MRTLLLVLVTATLVSAAAPTWLDLVDPVITPAEKKAYLALSAAERAKYEEGFWSGKAVTSREYGERMQYVDSMFGSTKPGSGARTDQGRVYLALGAPNRITRIPSSHIFWPVEIWYYSAVPGVLNTEVNLMFFQKNGTGLMRLYSPTLDTIRALLIPQSSTVHMFGPNDDINEAEIRNNLQVSPAEDEIVTASVQVATGVKYEENEGLLAKVASPSYMLRIPPKEEVHSRVIISRLRLDTVETPSPFGGTQVDLKFETPAQKEIGIEVSQNNTVVFQNQVHLRFSDPQQVTYTQRLDLLPGSWRLIVMVDGAASPYQIEVPKQTRLGEIQRATIGGDVSGRETPFEFEGRQVELNPSGGWAFVPLPHPGKVTWMVRRGGEMLWRGYSEGKQVAWVQLPVGAVEPGSYKIEAIFGDDSSSTSLELGKEDTKPAIGAVLSYNANLAPARRFAFIGHQWLLLGNFDEARRSLQASLANGITSEARIELARADALGGDLDAARDEVKIVLSGQPNNFEALSVYAYIETRFQDYAVARDLYRKALAVQDSPAIRAALSGLPVQ